MISIPWLVSTLFLVLPSTNAANFAFEEIQLKESDIGNNPDIAFGEPGQVNPARCKAFPGDADWPSLERWTAFNTTLEGKLVKGLPPAATCYNSTPYFDQTKCAATRRGWSSSLFTGEDPVMPNSAWPNGNTCPLPPAQGSNPYTCNITGYPAYVVNATTVKHVQLAINFARNNNIRVTIKNTGHDFVGRNTGGGAIQVWTHYLKGFEYLPSFQVGEYSGKAARVGSALQQYELFAYMNKTNITVHGPGGTTVGAYGGYMQGGGFSILSSKYALTSDEVLSLEVVTADGRFVHADPLENKDLFWAIRGGGPGNFGVVTSLVIKVWDPIPITVSSFNWQTNPVTGTPGNNVQVDVETFWKGVHIYFAHLERVTYVEGIGWNYIYNRRPNFQFVGRFTFPGLDKDEVQEFLAPLFTDLIRIGIRFPNPEPTFYRTYPEQEYRPNGPGDGAGSYSRLGSRLIPATSLADSKSAVFNNTISTIRTLVQEGGYTFHSVDFAATKEKAGYPGADSAVNPALRNALMHVTSFDTESYGPDVSQAQQLVNYARFNSFIQKFRDITPGGGAYMNEADAAEPNFQQSFYGSNYERLLIIKKNTDPWGVFYAVTAVGSDAWTVEGTNGLPTQNGRLCKVST